MTSARRTITNVAAAPPTVESRYTSLSSVGGTWLKTQGAASDGTNIYCALSYLDLGSTSQNWLVLCKFDLTLSLVWQRSYKTDVSNNIWPNDLIIASNGDLYVLATIYSSTYSGRGTPAIFRFNTDGDPVSGVQINEATNNPLNNLTRLTGSLTEVSGTLHASATTTKGYMLGFSAPLSLVSATANIQSGDVNQSVPGDIAHSSSSGNFALSTNTSFELFNSSFTKIADFYMVYNGNERLFSLADGSFIVYAQNGNNIAMARLNSAFSSIASNNVGMTTSVTSQSKGFQDLQDPDIFYIVCGISTPVVRSGLAALKMRVSTLSVVGCLIVDNINGSTGGQMVKNYRGADLGNGFLFLSGTQTIDTNINDQNHAVLAIVPKDFTGQDGLVAQCQTNMRLTDVACTDGGQSTNVNPATEHSESWVSNAAIATDHTYTVPTIVGPCSWV